MGMFWTEDLTIGIESIDQEHKEIFEEFDRLYALMRVGGGHDFYRIVLDFLVEYISKHLENEEVFMKRIGYDGIKGHKTKHNYFKQKVLETDQNHRVGKITNQDMIQLNLMLKNWLKDHILTEDVKIFAFIKNNDIRIN